jgi:hypothetical protein
MSFGKLISNCLNIQQHLLPCETADAGWVKRRCRKRLGNGLHRDDSEMTMDICEEKITLLIDECGQQCCLGGQQSCLGGDLITEIFFFILVVRFLPLRFKFFDRDAQFSDLLLNDFYPRIHCFPIFTNLPEVLRPGT